MDRGQEVDGPLVVAGRDGAVLLELGEEILDGGAPGTRPCRRGAGSCGWPWAGSRLFLPASTQGLITRSSASNALSAIRVSAASPGSRASAPPGRAPARESKAGRVAERVDHRVDLGAQPASTAPEASSEPLFSAPGAVLMGPDDGAVEHRVFVVRLTRQMPRPAPRPALGPAAEAGMHLLPITEAGGQVARQGMPAR